VQALVWSATSSSVRETWVDGRRVYASGVVTTVPDESGLRREARERAARLITEAGLDHADVPTTTSVYE
jgi:hypothetical protein